METYTVRVEMISGESFKYELESENESQIFDKFSKNQEWVELNDRGETHYIQTSNIERIKLKSESLQKQRSAETARAWSNFNG